MWFKIDFYELAQQYLMVGLRRKTSLSFFAALINPIKELHYDWMQFRKDNLYKIAHTGQVCYLRGALNDKFDPELRRIKIDGVGDGVPKTYIYTPPEKQTKYLGRLYIHSRLELVDTGADFTVYVPKEIMVLRPFEVRAEIDSYRAGGKRYLIIER